MSKIVVNDLETPRGMIPGISCRAIREEPMPAPLRAPSSFTRKVSAFSASLSSVVWILNVADVSPAGMVTVPDPDGKSAPGFAVSAAVSFSSGCRVDHSTVMSSLAGSAK